MGAVEGQEGVVILGGPRPLTPDTARTHARRMLARVDQRLLEVDRDGTLVETLRAFLDSAAWAPAAAAALQIHRTTLYYRLSRVEELLGIDLSDGRTRLSLHLGIALLDLMPGLRRK